MGAWVAMCIVQRAFLVKRADFFPSPSISQKDFQKFSSLFHFFSSSYLELELELGGGGAFAPNYMDTHVNREDLHTKIH